MVTGWSCIVQISSPLSTQILVVWWSDSQSRKPEFFFSNWTTETVKHELSQDLSQSYLTGCIMIGLHNRRTKHAQGKEGLGVVPVRQGRSFKEAFSAWWPLNETRPRNEGVVGGMDAKPQFNVSRQFVSRARVSAGGRCLWAFIPSGLGIEAASRFDRGYGQEPWLLGSLLALISLWLWSSGQWS